MFFLHILLCVISGFSSIVCAERGSRSVTLAPKVQTMDEQELYNESSCSESDSEGSTGVVGRIRAVSGSTFDVAARQQVGQRSRRACARFICGAFCCTLGSLCCTAACSLACGSTLIARCCGAAIANGACGSGACYCGVDLCAAAGQRIVATFSGTDEEYWDYVKKQSKVQTLAWFNYCDLLLFRKEK